MPAYLQLVRLPIQISPSNMTREIIFICISLLSSAQLIFGQANNFAMAGYRTIQLPISLSRF